MKKVVGIIAVMAVLGAVLYAARQAATPRSVGLEKSYKALVEAIDEVRFLKDSFYRSQQNREIRNVMTDLASAYMHEEKPDLAIPLWRTLIEMFEGPQFEYGMKMPVTSAQLELQALYYERLAEAYGKTGEAENRKKAEAKVTNIKARAVRLAAKERSEQKTRKDPLLD